VCKSSPEAALSIHTNLGEKYVTGVREKYGRNPRNQTGQELNPSCCFCCCFDDDDDCDSIVSLILRFDKL
jgi:hypothetical protein